MADDWIQKSIKHPGRTTNYMRNRYGDSAFNKDGTIKDSYLKKAAKTAKTQSMKSAINEALTLHKIDD